MKITTRNVQFRDSNGRMVSSAIIANGSLHDEVVDYLDNNPQALGDAVADATESWLAENITGPTQPAVDASLSVTGAAADAKKVGDELSDLKSEISDLQEEIESGTGSGLTSAIKSALLQLADFVAYINANGRTYRDALYDAFYPPVEYTAITLDKNSLSFGSLNTTQQLTATTTPRGGAVTWTSSNPSVATVSQTGLVTAIAYGNATITASCGSLTATCSVAIEQATVTSISAVYTQSGTVYTSTALDDLKNDLVVTANWSNGTTSTVAKTDYTLSGTLAEGISTITVSYGDKATTFNVTVFSYTVAVENGLIASADGAETARDDRARSDYLPISDMYFRVGVDINNGAVVQYAGRYYDADHNFIGASNSWTTVTGEVIEDRTKITGTVAYARFVFKTNPETTITEVSGFISTGGVRYTVSYS